MSSVEHSSNQSNNSSERRQRLHELLIALLQGQNDIELMEDDASNLENSMFKNNGADPSLWIERNRRIINKYQALVRSALALDALMDSETHDK